MHIKYHTSSAQPVSQVNQIILQNHIFSTVIGCQVGDSTSMVQLTPFHYLHFHCTKKPPFPHFVKKKKMFDVNLLHFYATKKL